LFRVLREISQREPLTGEGGHGESHKEEGENRSSVKVTLSKSESLPNKSHCRRKCSFRRRTEAVLQSRWKTGRLMFNVRSEREKRSGGRSGKWEKEKILLPLKGKKGKRNAARRESQKTRPQNLGRVLLKELVLKLFFKKKEVIGEKEREGGGGLDPTPEKKN